MAACGTVAANSAVPALGGPPEAEQEAGLLVCVFMRMDHVEDCMKDWHKPEVVEQDVGMEVTSYLPAELDA